MSRKGGQRDRAAKAAEAGWKPCGPTLTVRWTPGRDSTSFVVERSDGPCGGGDRSVLAGGYLDVTVEAIRGRALPDVLHVLSNALEKPYPACEWRPGGLGQVVPQRPAQPFLDGLEDV